MAFTDTDKKIMEYYIRLGKSAEWVSHYNSNREAYESPVSRRKRKLSEPTETPEASRVSYHKRNKWCSTF